MLVPVTISAVFLNIFLIRSVAHRITDWKADNQGMISAEGLRIALFMSMSQIFVILLNLLSSGLLSVHRK